MRAIRSEPCPARRKIAGIGTCKYKILTKEYKNPVVAPFRRTQTGLHRKLAFRHNPVGLSDGLFLYFINGRFFSIRRLIAATDSAER